MDPFKIENRTTGFGNPSRSYVKSRINPSDILIQNPSSTFFFEWEGDESYGISKGDKIIVDRSINPNDGDLVVVISDGKLKCCKFTDKEDLDLWGTITWKLTDLRK